MSKEAYFRSNPMEWFKDGSQRYSKYHWDEIELQARVVGQEVQEAIQKLDNPVVGVIGFGFGRETEVFFGQGLQAEIIGVDINGTRFDEAKKMRPHIFNEKLDILVASMNSLPIENDSFDATVCLETMMHSDNPGKTLEELTRVTKPSGIIVFNMSTSQGLLADLLTMTQNEGLTRVAGRIKERVAKDKDSSGKRTQLYTLQEIARFLANNPGTRLQSVRSYLRGMSTLFVLKKETEESKT
ncbi:MAG: hypothetical protein A3A51_02120 [Candidatus Levybacteria bacterium RIFCSPLOWO2_01_FULL_39_10]|nr:MAG: hypothetical protein A3A51_02120 [Candidatus Levybacteria bacterium RIFCSPLOWO2_01_FULL_39_10]